MLNTVTRNIVARNIVIRRRFWRSSVQAVFVSVVLGGMLLPRIAKAVGIPDELAEAVIATQVVTVDRYNGGLAGDGGFGAYRAVESFDPSWNGFSYAFLNRDFSQRAVSFPARGMNHLIGQSRVIYINAETHRLLGAEDSRFRQVAQQAADFLLETAWDETYGGWYWGIEPGGENPPLDNSPMYGSRAQDKDAYGQVHASLSLAKAYAITQDPDHLEAALKGWEHFKIKHADDAIGSYTASFNRDYTEPLADDGAGTRNNDYMLHAFETAMALSDVTEGTTQNALRQDAYNIGQHIVSRMVQPDETSWTGDRYTRAYVPWFFTPTWAPMEHQPEPTEAGFPAPNYTSPGHQLEMALFLSRAVERGIGDPRWLTTAEQLLNHTLHYSYDATQGTVNYSRLLLTGDLYASGQDVKWWPQAEAARAFAHFAIVRDRPDLWDEFELTLNMIQTRLTDPVYGGWFHSLSPETLLPTNPDKLKGQPWKVYYHVTMLQAELVRLNDLGE